MFGVFTFPSFDFNFYKSPETNAINNKNTISYRSLDADQPQTPLINSLSAKQNNYLLTIPTMILQKKIINHFLEFNAYAKLARTSKQMNTIIQKTLNEWNAKNMTLTPKVCHSFKMYCQYKFQYKNAPQKPIEHTTSLLSLSFIANLGFSFYSFFFSTELVEPTPTTLLTAEERQQIEINAKRASEFYKNTIKTAKGYNSNRESLWFKSDELFSVNFHHLQLLKLDSMPINTQAFHAFLKSHVQNDQYSFNIMPLQTLSLKWIPELTDETVDIIAKHCLYLQNLNLEGVNQITDLSIIKLAKYCIRIKKINLNLIPKLTDQSIIAIANNCSNLNTLKIMGNTHISDRAMIALCQNSKLLEVIDLRSTRKITDSGITSLAVHCPNLKEIYLAKINQLTNISLKSLARHASNLEKIDLIGVEKINISGLETLFKNRKLKKIYLDNLSSMEYELLQQTNLKIKIESQH